MEQTAQYELNTSILGYWKTDEEFETSMCFLSVHNAQRELRTGYFYYILKVDD